jgi:hypothetical protein
MSSIIIAGALITIIVIICLVLVSINNTHRKKLTLELVSRFNDIGIGYNLSFSNKEIFKNFIIGLDELRKKLLILRKTDDKLHLQVIDLKEVKSCSKQKIYKTVNMGTIKKEQYEKHIDKIVLEFVYTDIRDPVQIIFYESAINNLAEMFELDQKTYSWETILTKTINKMPKAIA